MREKLENLARIGQLKAQPPARYEGHLEVDRSLVEATIRVATEVQARVEDLESPT